MHRFNPPPIFSSISPKLPPFISSVVSQISSSPTKDNQIRRGINEVFDVFAQYKDTYQGMSGKDFYNLKSKQDHSIINETLKFAKQYPNSLVEITGYEYGNLAHSNGKFGKATFSGQRYGIVHAYDLMNRLIAKGIPIKRIKIISNSQFLDFTTKNKDLKDKVRIRINPNR